jgi:hypothetical protein
MTGWRKRTIMEMAREVKMPYDFVTGEPINLDKLEAFATLIREEATAKATAEANAKSNASWAMMCEKMVVIEREACAKVCEDGNFLHAEASDARFGKACATAIRNRGQA